MSAVRSKKIMDSAACHDAMDGRTQRLERFGDDWHWFALRGVYRTQQSLIEKVILVVK